MDRLGGRQPVEVNLIKISERARLFVRWFHCRIDHIQPFEGLAKELGKWPIFLELAGDNLQEGVRLDGLSLKNALTDSGSCLQQTGFYSF